MLKELIEKIDLDKTKIWVTARAVERSTWEGIIGAVTITASYLKPAYKDIIIGGGGAIWSLIRIITKDAQTTLGKALKAATEAHDELKK